MWVYEVTAAMKTIIKNTTIVNEGKTFHGDVVINGERIEKISTTPVNDQGKEIDGEGLILMPGVIDDQVHFREPGLTHKADIATESRAAVAGGTTTFMEMPNTKPQAVTIEKLEEKYEIAAKTSPANYSFFMGATNENIEELRKVDHRTVCGVKVFMGSSTGNMLVDNRQTLDNIFSQVDTLIATHCEDEATIRKNEAIFREKYGENVPFDQHPIIRSAEACYLSSSLAVELAKKHNARLHILHLTTARELDLFDNTIPLSEKRITSEVCVHHLTFTSDDYTEKGSLIKCNPAIKTPQDRDALWKALNDNRLDIIATDHAPHTWEEKQNTYFKAPSGLPLVQHSLLQMLEHVRLGRITLEKMVEKMTHAPAECFRLEERGYIREGYFADLVLVDRNTPYTVTKENILAKCGWSPFEGKTFRSSINRTFVNGNIVYENGKVIEGPKGRRVTFDRS